MNKQNHVVLQGRLSFDPDIKEFEDRRNPGRMKKLGKFKMACSSGRGTLFIDVDVWDEKLVQVVEQLQKGEEIILTGELRSDSWAGKDGEKKNKHLIVADSLRRAEDSLRRASDGTQESIETFDAPF